jgi:protein involved in polysaccharide export with SLBB domain
MIRPLLCCLLLLCGARLVASEEPRLRDGDIFRLAIDGSPRVSTSDFETEYTVQNGSVTLPMLGRMSVAELTQRQLAVEIERRFKDGKIFTNPGVTIHRLQGRAAQGRAPQGVVIGGEVRVPGRYPWTAGMTLTQAIGSAGGFTALDFGGDRVRMIRDGKATVFRLKAIRKDPKLDPRVRAGDVIEVGDGDF